MSMDITFCVNYQNCKLKEKCKRVFTKKLEEGEYNYHSYADFYKKDEKCEFFIKK